MQISLLDVISTDGKVVEFTSEFEREIISFQMGSYKILNKEPISVKAENKGKKVIKLTGQTKVSVAIPCDRCLKDVKTEIMVEIDREIDFKLSEQERMDDLDECSYITGVDLDVDQLVYLEILMNWPAKVLCRKNCKGICLQCGKNLNEGSCSCEDLPKDPRMAAISDIFRKFNEEV